jgi:hypothetical protein
VLAIAPGKARRSQWRRFSRRPGCGAVPLTDAVEVLEHALAHAQGAATLQPESQLVAVGPQDARHGTAHRARDGTPGTPPTQSLATALAVAQGMVASPDSRLMRRHDAGGASRRERARGKRDYARRALWSFADGGAIRPGRRRRNAARASRPPSSSRGLAVVHSTAALLHLAGISHGRRRCAHRAACRTDGDFAHGLTFAATVLARRHRRRSADEAQSLALAA